MVEGGMKCVKYLLFVFNLIFFLAGLGLIIVGAVVQTRFQSYFNFFGGNFSAAAIFVIVVGAIVFLIGFFGCCGAYKENYCMTMTFAILLGIIFILEVAAAIAAYVMRDKVHSLVQDGMQSSMQNYYSEGSKGVTDTWEVVQNDFQCCGVSNYSDWYTASQNTNHSVPDSCCKKSFDDCGYGKAEKLPSELNNTIYMNGCLHKLETWAANNIVIIGGAGIGLAFVQLVGIFLACCLARTIKKEYQEV